MRNFFGKALICLMLLIASNGCLTADQADDHTYVVRYVWFDVEQANDTSSPDKQLAFQTGNISVEMGSDAKQFLTEMKKTWPQYNYKLFATGALMCKNGETAEMQSGPFMFDSEEHIIKIGVRLEEKPENMLSLQWKSNLYFDNNHCESLFSTRLLNPGKAHIMCGSPLGNVAGKWRVLAVSAIKGNILNSPFCEISPTLSPLEPKKQ